MGRLRPEYAPGLSGVVPQPTPVAKPTRPRPHGPFTRHSVTGHNGGMQHKPAPDHVTAERAVSGSATAAHRAPSAQPGMFSVLVVCSGNICRSPMGEKVLERAFDEAGLADTVTVVSAGTGDWHVGQGANAAARRVLAAAGYPTEHGAQHVTREMVGQADLVLAADHGHLATLRRLSDRPASVRLIRSFDPGADGDEVPDPYGYDDDAFREVLAMLQAAAPGILDAVEKQLA